MSAKFQPRRLQQARHLKRLTLEDLGQAIDLKRQSLSQFERGERSPSPQTLKRLADALSVPLEFFLRPFGPLEASQRGLVHYRALKKTRDVIREQQRAAAILDLCASLVDTLQEHIEYEVPSLPRLSDDICPLELDLDAVELIALDTRRALGLGNGPISDITLLVENQSVIVAYVPLPDGVDGLSASYGDRPFIVVSSTATLARSRINVAHEFGHLILHHGLADETDLDEETFKLVEQQAWRFAGAFLLPQKSFLADVYNVSLDALAILKEKWGISVAAMIQRLLDLGVIDKEQQRYLRIQMAQRQWTKTEPGDDAPRERARLLNRAATFLQSEGELSLAQLGIAARLPLQFVADALEVDTSALLPPVPKNVVQFRMRST